VADSQLLSTQIPLVQKPPQRPQWLGSLVRSTQRPAHKLSPGSQAGAQLPAEQTSPAPQTTSQPPQ